MTETAGTARIELRLDRSGVDDEEADRLTRSLRRAIEDADLADVRVERVTGTAPAGAKDGGVTLAALAVAVAPVLVDHVIQIVRDWCRGPDPKPVKLTLRVDGREIGAEYDASKMTAEEVRTIADKLRAALKG